MDDIKKQLQGRVEKAISDQVFPGCVVGVISADKQVVLPFGSHTYENEITVTEDAVYDISSVTKSIATCAVLLKFIDSGDIGLNDPVVDYIPEFNSGPEKEAVTIKHLLTYTIDLELPSKSDMYAMPMQQAFSAILSAPLRHPPGKRYRYAKPTALLMGLVAERVSGKRLDESSQEIFFQPLGMQDTTFHPENISSDRIPPAEVKDDGKLIHGVVHDEGTGILQEQGMYYGASGLFSTVPDLLRILQMLLNNGELDDRDYLSPLLMQQMLTPQFTDGEHTAGLGWDIGITRFMGRQATKSTFGKTGFTGCLMSGDHERDAGLVLLSNRTYPRRPDDSQAINAVRRDIADMVWEYTDNN